MNPPRITRKQNAEIGLRLKIKLLTTIETGLFQRTKLTGTEEVQIYIQDNDRSKRKSLISPRKTKNVYKTILGNNVD